jgi:predicted amidohydrolase YtcJ
MQPFHKADDGRYAEEVIGTERCKTSYAYRDILRSGGLLAFGSDFDVVTINPWVGIETAVTGRISTGKIWMPHQNITLDQALTAYSKDAAYSMFMEHEIGRIAPGYHADFVILDRRLKADGSNVGQTRPAYVFVEGKDQTVQDLH